MPSRRARRAVPSEPQLAFDDLLGDAERHNADREWERATAHLPATMATAIPFFRALLEQHHAAMLAADLDEVRRHREDAAASSTRMCATF